MNDEITKTVKKTSEALNALSKRLKENSFFYYDFQANVSSCLYGELRNSGIPFEEKMDICNKTANNFLGRLTNNG